MKSAYMVTRYRCISCGERYSKKELKELDYTCPECGEDYFEEIEEEFVISDDEDE